jgi:hypothetical protein
LAATGIEFCISRVRRAALECGSLAAKVMADGMRR